MHVLLVSTYDLGRQPFALAEAAAWLRDAGHTSSCLDLARERFDAARAAGAGLVAFHLPMHTATRLAVPAIARVRAAAPGAHLCAYGVYAPPNAGYLRSLGVATVLGVESEPDLVALAGALDAGRPPPSPAADAGLPRLRFVTPDRSGLPPLRRYAGLVRPDGQRVVSGYTEASRGCLHQCRHCPIVPVYGGRFRVVQPDVVLDDVRAQVEAGARHVTFGDPDFFNGPSHARRIVERLARELPGVTYDVTIKVEHLLRHRALLPVLRETGCLFVTSAVESVDDRVLAILEKGHSRADVATAAALMRDAALTLVPTFVPFTPWTTVEDYRDLLETIAALDLVEHAAPIQLAIRLLLPAGSRLLERPDVRAMAGAFDEKHLAWPWQHPDPRVDALHADVMDTVVRLAGAPRSAVFDAVCDLAGVNRPAATPPPLPSRATIPYLTEPWYC